MLSFLSEKFFRKFQYAITGKRKMCNCFISLHLTLTFVCHSSNRLFVLTTKSESEGGGIWFTAVLLSLELGVRLFLQCLCVISSTPIKRYSCYNDFTEAMRPVESIYPSHGIYLKREEKKITSNNSITTFK